MARGIQQRYREIQGTALMRDIIYYIASDKIKCLKIGYKIVLRVTINLIIETYVLLVNGESKYSI